MAEKDFNTGKAVNGKLWWTDPQGQDLISILRAIRAAGDLLTGAAGSVSQGRHQFREHTLAELGGHLEDLATMGLVLLGYEGAKEGAKPQAAAQGGVS